jgi:hemerythrin-like domain-containing protein
MLREHQLGRAHVKAIDEALGAADQGDEQGVRTVFEEGAAYLDLLRNHILKEDNVLFEMADQLIQGADLSELTSAYGDAESAPGYLDTLSRCHAIADELMQTYGISNP